jgi:lysyl-tRNA synthetase class 2
MDETSELVQQRIRKLEALRKDGVDPYPNDFRVTHTSRDLYEAFDSLSDDELKSVGETFSLAGRIVAIRDFGKASFIQIQDRREGYRSICKRISSAIQPFNSSRPSISEISPG